MGPAEDDDDDLPATQPVLSIILEGVVAYVEVRSGYDNRSQGVKAQLRNLGATISETLTKEVTHVIFNEGLPSSYKKAKRFKCHMVSVLWIEACKEAYGIVSEAGYPPIGLQIYEDPESLKNFKKLKSMQPDFEDIKGEKRIEKILHRIKRRKHTDCTSKCQTNQLPPSLKSPWEEHEGNRAAPDKQSQQPEDSASAPHVKKTSFRKVKRKTRPKPQQVGASNEVTEASHEKLIETDRMQPDNFNKNVYSVNENVVITISSSSENSEEVEAKLPLSKDSKKLEPTCSESPTQGQSQWNEWENISKTETAGIVDILAPKTPKAPKEIKRKGKGASPMSRNEFVNRLSEFVVCLKQGSAVKPCWISPKQDAQGSQVTDSVFVSTNTSPRRSGRCIEKEPCTKAIGAIVNPVNRVTKPLPYVSASATLAKRYKAPAPPSPKEDFILLSQEPTDVASSVVVDGVGKGAKEYLGEGEHKVKYTDIISAYDAYAKKVSGRAEQVQNTSNGCESSKTQGCELSKTRGFSEESEEVSSQSLVELKSSRPQTDSQGSSPDVWGMANEVKYSVIDAVAKKVSGGAEQVQNTSDGCESSKTQGYSEESEEVSSQSLVELESARPHTDPQGSSPNVWDMANNKSKSDVESVTEICDSATVHSENGSCISCSVVPQVNSSPGFSGASEASLITSSSDVHILNDSLDRKSSFKEGEEEERVPSPVFVINRPKVRRPFKANSCTSSKHENLLHETKEIQKKDQIHLIRSCTQYLNKTLQAFQPKPKISSTPDLGKENLGDVLVHDTPEAFFVSEQSRLQDKLKVIIPPTPEEKLTSPESTEEQTQTPAVISALCKSLKVPLFARKIQEANVCISVVDPVSTSRRMADESDVCEVRNSIKCETAFNIDVEQCKLGNIAMKREGSDSKVTHVLHSPVRRSPRISSIIALVKQEKDSVPVSSSDSSESITTQYRIEASKHELRRILESVNKPAPIRGCSSEIVQASDLNNMIKRRSKRSFVRRSDNEENKSPFNKNQEQKSSNKSFSNTGHKICAGSHLKQTRTKVEDTFVQTLKEERFLPSVSRKLRNRKPSVGSVSEPSPKRRRSENRNHSKQSLLVKGNPKKKSDVYEENEQGDESNKERQVGDLSSRTSRQSVRGKRHVGKEMNNHKKVKEECTEEKKGKKRMLTQIKQEEPFRRSPRRKLNLSCPEQLSASFDTSGSNISTRSLQLFSRSHPQEMKPKVRITRLFSLKTMPSMVCTFLSASEQVVVKDAVKSLGHRRLEDKVTAQTTHVITTGPKRTMNMLKGLVRGCWLLHLNWVLESIKKGCWLPEGPFEMTQFSPAVKECRERRQALGVAYQHTLFANSGPIFVSPQIKGPPVEDLCELLELCGAELAMSWQKAKIVIGIDLSKKSNAICVNPVWALDSITHNKLLPLDDSTYCIATKK